MPPAAPPADQPADPPADQHPVHTPSPHAAPPRLTGHEVRLWRQFLAVAEALHFGRAAERLHMTQPALTLAIQQLERHVGVPLLARTRRSVALTEAGAALLEPVRDWLRQGEALIEQARAIGQGDSGRLRLGFVSTVGFGALPHWLLAFRAAHAGVTVELREATTDVQLRALQQAELDAGFVLHAPGMAPAGWLGVTVGRERMVLALPQDHALARAPRLSRSALLREPLVLFPRDIAPSLFDAVLSWYHAQGASPRIAQEAIQMQTIVNLVSAGLGLAWVPETVTQLQRPGVVYRALPAALAAGAPECETSLLWRPDAPACVARFVGFVQQRLGELGAAVGTNRRERSARRGTRC